MGTTPTVLNKNTVYKLSVGYYHADRYYKTPGDTSLSGEAAVGDVVAGKTFYSNSYTKQTGTLAKETALSGSLSGTTYTVKTSGTTGYHSSQLSLAVDPTLLGLTLKSALTK